MVPASIIPMQHLHKHILLHWLLLHPLHRSGWTLLSLLLLVKQHPRYQLSGCPSCTTFCNTATHTEPKYTYCRKGKHTIENHKAKKKAKKKADSESRASRTPPVSSLAASTVSTVSIRAPVYPTTQGISGTSQPPPDHMTLPNTPKLLK